MDKIFKSCNAEIKVSDSGFFEAYGSVFDVIDSHNDAIAPGAFAESLASGLPKFCSNHDWAVTCGRFDHCEEDSKGLFMRGRFNLDQPLGNDLYHAYKSGDQDSFSVGGYVSPADTVRNAQGVRTINKMRLVEVSAVLVGSNPEAKAVTVKSLEHIASLTDIEDSLRAAGYSQRGAQMLMRKFKELVAADKQSEELDVIAQRLASLAG